MRAVRNALISTAGVGALMAAMGTTPAAAGAINFTWNPNGSATPISSNAGSEFTANDLTVADYSNVIITQTGVNSASATEAAYLVVTGANFSGSPPTPVATPGLQGNGAGPYQLFFSITATATATGSLGGPYTGYFTSISYSLIGAQNATCGFSASSSGVTVSSCGTENVLAMGTLVPGQVTSGTFETNYVDTAPVAAGAIVSIAEGPGANNFFVNPLGSALAGFEFITDFTNNRTNLIGSTAEDIVINGGGGNINMIAVPVPEPLTISLFGAGLAGAAAFRRRRSKKA